MPAQRAVFLDRDGVLVEDAGLAVPVHQMKILAGVPQALLTLHAAGFALVVVTNQAAVARGLMTEQEVQDVHHALGDRIMEAGGPELDAWYFCPHHPSATRTEYRVVCDCRKPGPGMIVRAAHELNLDPAHSFMVGDRDSDLSAGKAAGCKTIRIGSPQDPRPLIEGATRFVPGPDDFQAGSLAEALSIILGATS